MNFKPYKIKDFTSNKNSSLCGICGSVMKGGDRLTVYYFKNIKPWVRHKECADYDMSGEHPYSMWHEVEK